VRIDRLPELKNAPITLPPLFNGNAALVVKIEIKKIEERLK
jgi:hypothetical protein